MSKRVYRGSLLAQKILKDQLEKKIPKETRVSRYPKTNR